MLHYIKSKTGKSPAPPTQTEEPVLSNEDEEFLRRITAEANAAAEVSLPPSPVNRPHSVHGEHDVIQASALDNPSGEDVKRKNEFGVHQESISATSSQTTVKDKFNAARSKWSWGRKDSRDAQRNATAASLMSAAENFKQSGSDEEGDEETRKEANDMADALEGLNLAAVDNKVFSISKETKDLLAKFTLILKDLMNGVPTAYHDLESLLTNSDDQLQRSYKHLPPWLQKIVQQLPAKIGKSVTPEMLAAAAEKHGVSSKYANMAAKGASKAGVKASIPSLQELVMKPGAIVGLLKTVLNFLKLRFPAFLGVNVIYSLALMVLLMILWYCWKRGREVRLEKEKLDAELELGDGGSDAYSSDAQSLRSKSPSSLPHRRRRRSSLTPESELRPRSEKVPRSLHDSGL